MGEAGKKVAVEEKALFQITVEGTYWADAPNNQVERKQYVITCNIPADRIASVNGILKSRVLPQLLTKNDPKFKTLRTFVITKSKPIGDVSFDHLEDVQQIRIMDMKQLTTFVKRKKLDVDVTLYSKIETLRKAVQLCIESPIFYKAKEAELSGGIILSSTLSELNQDAAVEITVEETDELDSVDKL